MPAKPFVLLAALAALAVLAQVPARFASTPATVAITPRMHAPMKLHGTPARNGKVNSGNWSGYVVTGSSFTYAKGSWIMPSVNCTKTPNTYAGFWVGIDGYDSTTVEQTGIAAQCSGKTPQYYAWYEFFPKNPVTITSVPVSPGNKISTEVSFAASKFTIKFTDETTGKSFTTTGTVAGALRNSAEWIAEAPTSITGVLPLADFGTGSFGDDYTSVTDTNWASDSAVTGPISDFGKNIVEITMVSDTEVTEAVPTALTTDGSSFKVAWKAE